MNYQEAYTSLLIMLSGALREEFIGNEKIQEDLEILKEPIDKYEALKKENEELQKAVVPLYNYYRNHVLMEEKNLNGRR